jgi:hypothetical protein
MKSIRLKTFIGKGLITLAAAFLVIARPVLGQSGGVYDLSWSTIDGGGGVSSGGDYILAATIGQPDAGYSAGGDYEVYSGFWPGRPVCTVNFRHFAGFADHWLETPCDAGNDWCGGADLNQLGDVNEVDLSLFVYEWLDYCPYRWPLR